MLVYIGVHKSFVQIDMRAYKHLRIQLLTLWCEKALFAYAYMMKHEIIIDTKNSHTNTLG